MTILDAVILLLVGGGAVRGATRGFTYEVLTLLSWLIGLVALRLFHAPVTAVVEGVFGDGGGAPIIALAAVFLVFFLGSRFVGQRLGIVVRQSFVGPFDRFLGFGFGALKSLILVTLMFLMTIFVLDIVSGDASDRPAWLSESRTYPLLDASGSAIVDIVEAQGVATPEIDPTDRN